MKTSLVQCINWFICCISSENLLPIIHCLVNSPKFTWPILHTPMFSFCANPENTNLSESITEQLTSCLFWFSCFAYVKLASALLVWLNPNQSNRRSAKQWYFPLRWVFSCVNPSLVPLSRLGNKTGLDHLIAVKFPFLIRHRWMDMFMTAMRVVDRTGSVTRWRNKK